MADVEAKETTKVAASPEKKVVEEEKKKVEEVVDEDSRASTENGDAKETKENGTTEEKEAEENEKEVESTENGDSTDAPADACSIKRKSTSGLVEASADATDGVAPEKKAKVDDKPSVEAAESNGEAKATA